MAPAFIRYGTAVLFVLAALIASELLQFISDTAPWFEFLIAVMISSWVCGVGPGFLAVLLSSLTIDYFFLPPLYSIGVPTLPNLRGLLVFVLSALLISWLSARRKRAEALLKQARDEMEARVQQRTAELKRTNEELQAEIAERKRAEQTLREQADLLDLTHDTIMVRDTNDAITYWNRGAEEMYGWTKEEALGKVSHRLLQTVFPKPMDDIKAELVSRGRWDGEVIHARRDGWQIVAASRWAVQRDRQGRPLATLEINNDITERRKAEDALRKMQAELAHVTRVLTMGELASSIAHEVNQPLTAVVTNGDASLRWLSCAPPDLDEARQAVERMIRAGKQASEVIGRIRAFLKKTVPAKVQLDINELIREVVALARGEAARHQVLPQIQLATDLPPVLGDRVQLQQVVLNLVMNGIEAMTAVSDRPRQLLISSDRSEPGKVQVVVKDCGIGLDLQSKDRLFDAFYTTKPEGMGMGLSISRSIVEAHGGRLWAAPNTGPGATFQFTLPTVPVNHD
jgi:PAS domain S-box-containing protein